MKSETVRSVEPQFFAQARYGRVRFEKTKRDICNQKYVYLKRNKEIKGI